MEITSLHKYISLNKLANGQTEVLFSGQPCIYTSKLNVITFGESAGDYHWKINPIFAKLVYGANVFEDIPQCSETFETDEEAIAAGLVKLHEMGAFSTEVDLPEDSYAATLSAIQDEVKATVLQSANGIMDAQKQYNESMIQIFGKELLEEVSKIPQKRKFTIHYTTKDGSKKKKSEEAYSPRSLIKSWKDTIENEYGGKLDDVKHKGVSVMNEVFDTLYIDPNEEKHIKWIEAVKAKHPDKNLQFRGRVEQGVHTTSAEVYGQDRSYGVFDHDKGEGHVFEENDQIEEKKLTTAEEKKAEEIVTALKKDKKFISKYGEDSAYAIATAKAKEVA